MIHGIRNRGLIVVWGIVLGMTGAGWIILATLGAPKPAGTAGYSTAPQTAEAEKEQTIERFQPTNSSVQMLNHTTPRSRSAEPTDQLPLVGAAKATAPAANNTAVGHILFHIGSIAAHEVAKPETVAPASRLAAPEADLPPVSEAYSRRGDQRSGEETVASNNLDAVPDADVAYAEVRNVLPTPPAPPISAETKPSSPAIASSQTFKFHIRGSASNEARGRELANRLQTNFNQIAEWQIENYGPATAVIRYPATIDHATAMDVAQLVGRLGYPWRIEKLPPRFTDRTIDIWLPDARPLQRIR